MKNYRRIMLGQGSIHASECVTGQFVGTDFLIHHDLTARLPEDWRKFNQEFIPIYLDENPDKSRIAAGMACGALWTVSKGMQKGDIVLCPDGTGHYHVGEVTGDYIYQPDGILPHRRAVHWFSQMIDRAAMSSELKSSTSYAGTVVNVTNHQSEIEKLLSGITQPTLTAADEIIENLAAFAMEEHLQHFLIKNWHQTMFGKEFDIFEENGELVGREFEVDTGRIDILAISKDKKTLLVIELKRGRASDVVVGQILRYMGYVQEVLAEAGQTVKGAIIALEDDQRIRRALAIVPAITFYRYQVSFKLVRS